MSDAPRPTGESFALEHLRKNPNVTFEEVRGFAEEQGLVVQPIQFGRARRRLGLTAAGGAQPVERTAGEGDVDSSPTPTAAAASAVKPKPETKADTKAQPKPAKSGGSSQRKGSPSFEFLVEQLREEPTLSYGELKQRADAGGHKIAPIMYGRAKALLGLVPVRPRGQGKNRRQPASSGLAPAQAGSADQFAAQVDRVRDSDDLVRIVKELDAERRRLRSLLEQISSTISDALRG